MKCPFGYGEDCHICKDWESRPSQEEEVPSGPFGRATLEIQEHEDADAYHEIYSAALTASTHLS